MTASNFSEITKEEATKIPGNTKEEPPVLTKDQETKQLEDKRKKKMRRTKTGQKERK